MKILFINPRFPSYKGKDLFPIGIGYLAAIAEQFGSVTVLDGNVHKISEQDIADAKPDIVGVTSTTPSFPEAARLATIAREKTNAKIIFGGTHATFQPQEALQYADFVIRSEAESVLQELLQAIKNKSDCKNIKGISFKQNGKIVNNEDAQLICDLDSLPLPAYHLFPLKRYRIMSVITSRGCPHACAYCCASKFWKNRIRMRSADSVVNELKLLYEKGVRLIKFHDSTFTSDKERVAQICKMIIDEGLDIKWSCETRPDSVDGLLELMAESGCIALCFGLDSASPKVLKAINREINLDSIAASVKKAKELGIKARVYVTFGLPGETEQTVNETIEFLRKLKPAEIMLSLATAYPGTALAEGRKIKMPESWIAKFGGHGLGAELYFPESLTREQYKALAGRMHEEIEKLRGKA